MEWAGDASSVYVLEKVRKADAFSLGNTVNSVLIAWNSADTEALIINLIPAAFSTNSSDWIESCLAAANSVVQDLVDSTSRNTSSIDVAESWLADT